MKKIVYAFLVSSLMLTACSSATKEKLGLAKKVPDEFMIVPKAPLVLPPEYDFNPVQTAPNVKPEMPRNDLSSAESSFVSKFD